MEAEVLYQRVIEGLTRTLCRDHPKTLLLMENLASLLAAKAEGRAVAPTSGFQQNHNEKKIKKKGTAPAVPTPTQEEIDLADHLANELIIEEENSKNEVGERNKGGAIGKGGGGKSGKKKK